MARKAATKKKSPKKSTRSKSTRAASARGKKTAARRQSGQDLRRIRELGGLACGVAGIFLGMVLYQGWSGGIVGEALEEWLRYLLGVMTFLSPPALILAGAWLIFPEMPKGPRAFRVGAVILLISLLLITGANTFSLLGADPAHGQFFDNTYYAAHGGLAGEGLYWLTGSLIGDVGSTLAAIFLLAAAVFLLTGASVRAVLLASGTGARRAAVGARKTARQWESSLAERRGLSGEPAIAGLGGEAPSAAGPSLSAPFGVDPIAAAENAAVAEEITFGSRDPGAPLNGASTYPDLFAEEAEHSLRLVEDHAGADADLAAVTAVTAVVTEEKNEIQDELFPQSEIAEEVYEVPSTDMLRKSGGTVENTSDHEDRVRRVLEETLASFGIESQVVGTVSGPRVTRYEIKIASGIKLSKVTALKNDLAMALATTEIRILAPIPGKSAVGVEVPNLRPNIVTLGDIYRDFPKSAGPLSVWLGKDISGKAIYTDLARMPHLLVAGTTGSGKSGCIDCLISSILLHSTPDEVRLVLIDPKNGVELSHFERIPHLLTPVVTVMKDATNVLANLVAEMESRYSQMQLARTHNIEELNKIRRRRGQPPMPYVLLVVDELADLIMVSPTEVESAIIRLAQKSRAVGIHLVLATQRPSVDVITGMIKANIPSRISFAVTSQQDSRIILDTGGAESLLGQGDMLFSPLGSAKLQRIQGAYITKEEIQLLTDRCRSQRDPDFEMELLEGKEALDGDALPADEDELLPEAMKLVVEMGTASVSVLQRRLRVGYTRAGRLIDMLERRGVISGYEGSKPRRVLMSEEDLVKILGNSASTLGSPADRFAEDYDAVAEEKGAADDLE